MQKLIAYKIRFFNKIFRQMAFDGSRLEYVANYVRWNGMVRMYV